ncbi:MAG TPA: hypothetical protein VLZ81_12905, partial [Blastocatellia bacterium]|nr:hypothetical protein [Blastocatellia bacterium]
AATNSGSVVTVVSGAFTILDSGGTSPLPSVTSAHNVGKKLIVVGENFLQGAVVSINNTPVTTINKPDFSHKLVCSKGLKGIPAGTMITITVANPGGSVSAPITFTVPTG